MEEIVKYVLDLRENSRSRAALRRGGSVATEHYAYSYLSPWWAKTHGRKSAILSFAALAASTPRIRQEGGVTVGTLAANVVLSGKMTESSVARRLTVAQTAPASQLVILLRSVLSVANQTEMSLDYDDLYWLLARSYTADKEKQLRSRRRLLEAFYQQLDSRRHKSDEAAGERLDGIEQFDTIDTITKENR